jgi:hypothetical protein
MDTDEAIRSILDDVIKPQQIALEKLRDMVLILNDRQNKVEEALVTIGSAVVQLTKTTESIIHCLKVMDNDGVF